MLQMCKWNLGKLAEVLDPLLPLAEARAILDGQPGSTELSYDQIFTSEYNKLMKAKLGLDESEGIPAPAPARLSYN